MLSNFFARLKGSLKSKTVWFNLFIMGLGVASTVIPETNLPWKTQSLLLLVIGGLGLYLRFITKEDLADK